jgi:hypothetical protein
MTLSKRTVMAAALLGSIGTPTELLAAADLCHEAPVSCKYRIVSRDNYPTFAEFLRSAGEKYCDKIIEMRSSPGELGADVFARCNNQEIIRIVIAGPLSGIMNGAATIARLTSREEVLARNGGHHGDEFIEIGGQAAEGSKAKRGNAEQDALARQLQKMPGVSRW